MPEAQKMHVHLHVWRQKNPQAPGQLVDYEVDVSPDTSFLEMLDLLNESLIKKGEEPVETTTAGRASAAPAR